ncbi:MAG: DUF2924 domain-containing protein [Rhodospirillales bacterium]|nr:DUF2924 domain-containing protein [Rhodospirillales bacterium]
MPSADLNETTARPWKATVSRSDHAIERVAAELKAIRSLPRVALMVRWKAAYGRPPPKSVSRRLLEYAAAYHVQVKAFGGLKPAVQRRLLSAADRKPGTGVAAAPVALPKALAPGSRLVREWRGHSHTVEVLHQGFLCDGRHFSSLSEVARAITGTRWSGPRFFGL